ncbi:hypothetical protein [Rhodohalobacter sp.]|uniref:alpha/beta fold hydrolase n=1 Tax=Rhodohalobacter sp. TaxID=1974210 RepID=UPI002ACDA0D2|nr:hypothetical protein [Rhodohalobacter sp.]MDZ7756075.1 hypothetical protein [Rhodohalobacter sp.]
MQLIAGEKDSKFVHINRQMEKEIPDAKLEVVQNAGHRVHLDEPKAVVSIIEEVLIM